MYSAVRYGVGAVVLLTVVAARGAGAAIDLEMRPAAQSVTIGEVVEVGLYAVSDDASIQLLAAAQAIIAWEPARLQLLGLRSIGAVPLLSSSFPAGDVFGLNEIVPPQDGDGLYVAFAPLGSDVQATPAGALLVTFQFEALAPARATPVGFLDSAGDPPADTIVFDGTIKNLDVTGTLTGAVVEILPCCPADFDGDCVVSVTDLLIMLGAWGTDPGGPPDIDGSGEVDVVDLLALLGAWGPCP